MTERTRAAAERREREQRILMLLVGEPIAVGQREACVRACHQGQPTGQERYLAAQIGMSAEEYHARVAAGQRRCGRCTRWLAIEWFGARPNLGKTRMDCYCRPCRRAVWYGWAFDGVVPARFAETEATG